MMFLWIALLKLKEFLLVTFVDWPIAYMHRLKVISEDKKQSITDKYCRQTESERLDRLLNHLKTVVAVDGSVIDSFIEILNNVKCDYVIVCFEE